MSYPPGNPGYPPASPQAPQYASAPSYNSPQEPVPAGPSKLPQYLSIAVVVLGFLVYLSSFCPLFEGDYYTPELLGIGIVLSVVSGLLQGTSLLPKQKDPIAIVAVLSVLGFLLHLLVLITPPVDYKVSWGLYLVLAFSLLQAIVAVWALLLDAGVVTAPAPRPKYEQQAPQYNPYGAAPTPYYGQPHQLQQPPQQHQPPQQPHQAPPQAPPQGPPMTPQRSSYPPQFGGYPAGPTTVSFTPNTPLVSQSGPPTPPTGFPAYGQPQPSNQNQPTSILPVQSVPKSESESESNGESTSSSSQPPSDDSAPPPS